MKLVIMALVAFAAIGASAQDTTGCKISKDGKYATCLVTNLGEAGNQSAYVTFKIRGASAPVAPGTGCYGEAGNDIACPTSYGVPQWFKDLDKVLEDAGLSAPVDDEIKHPHGG